VCFAQPDFASLRDNPDVVLTLPDSSFPLADYMGLEVGEPFGLVTKFSAMNACFELEDTLNQVHNLIKTPFEGSCDVFVHENSRGLGGDITLPNPHDHSNVSPI